MKRFQRLVETGSQEAKKICYNCKYYKKTFPFVNKDLGLCKKTAFIDVVTGEKSYSYAEIARKYSCNGEWFEKAVNPFKRYLFKKYKPH